MKWYLAPAALATALAPAAADALSVSVGSPIKLTASDGAAFDVFGGSVGVSGSTALVGAYGVDDNGINSGSAYLFDTTKMLGEDDYETKLTASDDERFDSFGRSVSISGSTALVGADGDDDDVKGTNSGSAYLFDTTKMLGEDDYETKLTASDGAQFDSFGYSVSISGSTALVGAYGDDDDGINSGSAYLFDTTKMLGEDDYETKLTASDGAAGDWFGYSVGISGSTALVGAHRDDDNGSDSGSAYLFETDSDGTTTQTAKLTASDGAAGDWFGYSVGISGSTALVGARIDDDDVKGTNSGSAYLFETDSNGTTTQTAKLTASDGAASDFFGWSVAISDRFALVGAVNGGENNRGAAYLFDVASGAELLKIEAPDLGNSAFGRSVALFGDLLLIGDEGYTNDAGARTGAAYLYKIEVEVVPLPAGAWLLLSGLGGFALLRHRQRAAACQG